MAETNPENHDIVDAFKEDKYEETTENTELAETLLLGTPDSNHDDVAMTDVGITDEANSDKHSKFQFISYILFFCLVSLSMLYFQYNCIKINEKNNIMLLQNQFMKKIKRMREIS